MERRHWEDGDTLTATDLEAAFTWMENANKEFVLTDAATVIVDWDASHVQTLILGGNRTLTFSNPTNGARYVLALKQDGTGNRTITWPAGIKWPGGNAPTLTTTAGKSDIISLLYVGNSYYASATMNF